MAERWFLITEFARRCRIPVSTLRYYDRVGLLRPDHVDPVSGYRRYRAAQLTDALVVARLRAAGSSPEAIGRVLEGGAARESALAAERRRLSGEIRRCTDALASLDRLDPPAVGAPRPLRVAATDVVAMPFRARADTGADASARALVRAIATLRARLRRTGRPVAWWGALLPLDLDGTVTGHALARLHGDGPGPDGPGIVRLALPGGDAVHVTHHGPRDALGYAYDGLLDAVAAAGACPVGPVLERYPPGPGPTTEITVWTAPAAGGAAQESDSPRMKSSTLSRATESRYCSGGDFMK